ncbi:MAG: hypothetical protein E7455_04805 [Ruminococcaceae bacterium]|nr:hypothetical protein [Oscillospiraceae bacterium]
MKITKKIIAVLMVVAVLAVLMPAVFAAGTGAGSYVAGSAVQVRFAYKNETGVEGTISFSNPGLFKENVDALSPTITGNGFYNPSTKYWMSYLPTAGDIGIAFNLTIKDNAQVGDTCVITHTYQVSIDEGMDLSEVRTESITITVKAKPTTPTTQPTTPSTKPTTPSTKPTTPATKIDYTELNKQIDIAKGLDEKLYTDESWAALEAALKDAKAKKSSKSQSAVDAAAEALKNAIAALVEMDYSALTGALEQAEKLGDNDALAELFRQLCEAVAEGKELLNSGDQAAVNASAAKILDILAQIAEKMEQMGQSEIVEVPVEVEKEVLPSGEYCNIPMHKVWPILFWISLALNAGFILFFVIYFARKKKNRTDNTPLVDYDISDDEV